MTELAKNYDARAVEERWYRRWVEQGAFQADPAAAGDRYAVVIPPPNVTGILHMGHALNATIQDILVRWRRMQGCNTLWVPGTDHAGIATQNVVERDLRKKHLSRDQLGREKFVERVWQWREKYGNTITSQLKRLGASCDWSRERFTMDEGLSAAVAEVFVRLYEKKLVYRGNYIINWCPRCRTALSDEESAHVNTAGHLYYLRYPCLGGKRKEAVVVATTRPETMLGDVAVAVNPRDKRYAGLAGRRCLLPLLKRELAIIQDDFVDPEFGTGVVKITPAHDPNDFEMGRRHNLEPINVMDENGIMNELAGPYQGLDRFECRKRLLEDLTAAGLVEKVEEHTHAVGHCYRCDTVVEPRLSLQWFVRMKPLARPAIQAVKDGRIQFVPERWTKVYLDWMENIRDWCISRQIWWGHRIPVYYCRACRHEWAATRTPETCPACGVAEFDQDEDVLDTWFSSWLWPFSVLGWPARTPELAAYYPTRSLVTGAEIIFFWVARMIMAGLEFMDDIPFDRVYIHGTVRDDAGRKMSKSLGNSIDPLTVIDEFSADALRFSLMMVAAVGQDIHLANDKFALGRNFMTKIWNAARFMKMYTDSTAPGAEMQLADFQSADLDPDDKHILVRLNNTIAACTDSLERFRFNDMTRELYDFVWHQFCDWYIEYAKTSLNSDQPERRQQTLRVMHCVFSHVLRLLHPITPFITEELWHGMGYGSDDELLMLARWPVPLDPEEVAGWGDFRRMADYVENKHELIRIGRTLRTDYSIAPSRLIAYVLKPESAETARLLAADELSIASLLRASSITVDAEFNPPRIMPHGITRLGTIFMPIEGVLDGQAERKRLEDQLKKLTNDLASVNRKLDNIDFVRKAPARVIEQQKTRKQELLERCGKLQRLIAVLGG
ncbi:MAG: valine--tRNA ligase [Kiritimatiellia bacterium]